MKIGCSSWSYHRSIKEGKLNQETWIEKCAEELKLDGVELLDTHFASTQADYLRKIKKKLIDLGFLSIEFEGESEEMSFMPRGVAYLKRVLGRND